MRAIKGIKQKTVAVFLIIFISVVTTSVMISVYRGFRLTGQVLGKRALQAASQVHVNGDMLETVIKSRDEKAMEYQAIQKQLAFYQKVLNLKYLYTMTKNDKGEFLYVVDGTSPTSEDFSHLGDLESNTEYYKIYDIVMSGEVVNNDFTMDSKWGQLVSAYVPIANSTGRIVGFLGADIDAVEMLQVVKSNLVTTILCIIVILLIGVLAILFFARKLTDPIVQLRDYSLKVMNGEDVEPFEKVIKDEVGQLAAFMNNRINAIHNILDNTGEGLLTFDESHMVNKEYSDECIRIFNNTKLENISVCELFFKESMDDRIFMERNLEKIFLEKDHTRKNAYMSLLPQEIVAYNRNIKLKYKVINDVTTGKELIMVIMRDITDEKLLERRAENDRKTLDSIVRIMVNFSEFSSLVNNYYIFTSIEIWEMLESKRPVSEVIFDIYGKIHTFKGDFSIFGMEEIVTKLHGFEQELSLQLPILSVEDTEKVKEYFQMQFMDNWLATDLEQLSKVIGVEMVDGITGNKKTILIEDFKLERLELCIREKLYGEDLENVMIQLNKLRYKPLNELMSLYPDYVEQLSNRLNKQVERLTIKGGNCMIDGNRYSSFIGSLVHIFRNSVDHGIEDAEERVMSNKPEIGSITCGIELVDKLLTITITDDGRGIDLEKVKAIAKEKKFMAIDVLEQMEEQELTNLIFFEEFSTKDSLTEFSGRGIGLPAFRKELNKLGGTVLVKTKAGCGTSFIISIPNVDAEVE